MKTVLTTLLAICLCVPLVADEKKKERFEKKKAAAEKGDARAQASLGQLYSLGIGVEKNFKEAVKWFQKAADQGNALGQYNIGWHHSLGQGVEKDNVTAYAWWNIAEANGYEYAKKREETLAKKMTGEDITKAEALVKEMIKKNPKLIQKKK